MVLQCTLSLYQRVPVWGTLEHFLHIFGLFVDDFLHSSSLSPLWTQCDGCLEDCMGAHGWVVGNASHGSIVLSRGQLVTVETSGYSRLPSCTMQSLMWILKSWKNQSQFGKSPGNCSWKRVQTLFSLSSASFSACSQLILIALHVWLNFYRWYALHAQEKPVKEAQEGCPTEELKCTRLKSYHG